MDRATIRGRFDPVRYAYLEAANLNETTYTTAVDFSQRYTMNTSWPDLIKAQAYTQYKAAFDHLPAVVARDIQPLYGGVASGKFSHTNYVRGGWKNEMGETEPNANCTRIVDGSKQVCDWTCPHF
jgi:hypothetical protein